MSFIKKLVFIAATAAIVISCRVPAYAAEIDVPIHEEIINETQVYGYTISQTTYSFSYVDEVGSTRSVQVGINGSYTTNWIEGVSGWVAPCWATITSLKIDGVSRTMPHNYEYSNGSVLYYSFYKESGSELASKRLAVHFYCDEWGYDQGWYITME